MIPADEFDGEPSIPANASFWVPQLTYDDEGFGFFRSVWTIIEVTPAEARQVIENEKRLAGLIDGLSSDAEQFDRLAHFAEWWDPDETDDSGSISADERIALESALCELGRVPLESLELGVAGLVYAMSAAGCVTAASCRGHSKDGAWSATPVVYFAAEESAARSLESLAKSAGCLFNIDPARPELLVVGGESINRTMDLAHAIALTL